MKFGRNIRNNLEYRVWVTASFINFSSFKLDAENNANFDANFDEVHFLIKHIPMLTIFGKFAHIICRHLNIIHSSMNCC